MKVRNGAFIFAASIALACLPAQGQLSEASKQEILKYKLTMPLSNKLLAALPDMTGYLGSDQQGMAKLKKWMRMPLADQAKEVEADSGAMAILKKRGLTAKEYVVGVPTLRMAVMKASGRNSPNLIVSPANLEFARENLDILRPRMEAGDSGKAGLPRRTR
ncbi:MAG: hypothetical protein KIT09_19795 [Bryobacteraceae bacterium]|nr:hypothetical protein [Bryobacteraceae bacterium]